MCLAAGIYHQSHARFQVVSGTAAGFAEGRWIFWPLRIFIIFPIYQVLIVIIGAMFGQFNFFWTLEKKMLSRLGFKKFREKI